MSTILQAAGSSSDNGSRWAPIFTNRYFLGLWTNRNPLRSPVGVIYESYYKLGGTDVLIAGSNVEISNRLTICRRPGNTAGLTTFISGNNVPDIPDSFYSFHEINGIIRVFADTPTAPYIIGGFANGVGTASQGVIPIFTKAAGVTQSFFQGIGQSLYFSDALEQQKWLDFGVGNPGNSFSTITNTVLTSNVATITSVNNFAVGQTVVISQTTNGGGAFNGTFVITAVTPNTFQFNFTHANIGTAADTGFANATWNWGIAAPLTAPTLNIVASGAAAVQWVASTVFSTMGLIVDPNNNVEQMISVNATGTNTTQLGTTSNGEPIWNQTPGGTTTDNTITWTNWGPIPAWAAHQLYNNAALGGTLTNPSQIYDPASNTVQINVAPGNAQGTSGGTKPHFLAIQGANQHDPSNQDSPPAVKWFSIFPPPTRWKPNTAYPAFLGTDTAATCIIEPGNLPAGNNQPVYLQISGGGTSGASGTAPAFAPNPGDLTSDGDLIWLNLGSATRTNLTPYTQWTGTAPLFSVIKVGGNLYVCTQSGISASSIPTFDTAYGSKTTDGSVVWTSVGNSLSWVASTQWFLPKVGFAPPSGSQPYGGAQVIGSAFVQAVIASGKSGGSAPAWSTTIGNNTVDNAATWRTIAAQSTNSLTWLTGFGYVYAYKARTVVDQYSPTPLGLGLIPPGLTQALIAPTGSADGSVSTASPSVTMAVGANTGSVVNVSGIGSTDPQVDTIVIFRTFDGGATFFELTEINNPKPIGGVAQPWTFQDFLPSTAAGAFPGLNQLVVAPINHFNDPPQAGAINLVQYFDRIFYSVGAIVFCTEGPLVGGPVQPPGNGFTSSNPGQFWRFPSPVTRLVPSAVGLLVFTTSDVYNIAGGPNILTMFGNIYIKKLGLTSFNSLTERGTLIDLFTSDSQFVTFDPNLGVSRSGQPIADQFVKYGSQTTTYSPSTTYVTAHAQGANDDASYVADGVANWFRCVPTMAPDSSISGPVWSPKATIAAGMKAIMSVEVAPGQQALLIGATTANQPILVRDSTFTTFTDNNVAYSANYTFGSMVLANPGQLAEIGFVTCEFYNLGTSPKLSILYDEVVDTVLAISAAVQSGTNTTYTFTLTSGFTPVVGDDVNITGMADPGNNGTFIVTSLGAGTFTVVNANGVTRAVQTGVSTAFEDLSAYVTNTGLPVQDSPWKYGFTLTPTATFANRYYTEQSINGVVPPQGIFCRHMQVKINYGSDTVQNEILSQTVFGRHWQEPGS